MHLLVDESFRGAAGGGAEIVIHSDGSNCSYPFVDGASYVVYARTDPRDGFLYTSRCSETRPAVMMEGAMRELRAIRDGTRQNDVFGTIGINSGGGNLEAWIGARPLPGVPVRAVNVNGKSFQTQTDDRGVYAFSSLPSRTYKIEPDLPKGFAPPPFSADVSPGLACRIDHFAANDGQIEGTVVNKVGNPIAGFVMIQPADPSRPRGGLPGDDVVPDGKFKLPNLPPGPYRLVYHPVTSGVPNLRVTFLSDPIDLAFGEHILAFLFKVPL